MSDLNEQLLPCPFCGGTKLHIETMSVQPDDFHDAHVECDACEAHGQRAFMDGWLSSKEEAKSEAITSWNRRAPAAAPIVQPVGDELPPDVEFKRLADTILQATTNGTRNEALRGMAALFNRCTALAAPVVQAEPVAMVDEGDDGMFAEILPDRSVKVGQYLYAAPTSAAADAKDAARAMFEALTAAVECGMVPVSTAREGGATAHSIQVRVADQIRDAIAQARAAIATSADEVKS